MSIKNDQLPSKASVTKSELLQLVGIFTVWRSILFVIGLIADKVLQYQPSFPYADIVLAPSKLPQWVYSWANFDGVHYITIAQKGYFGTGLIQAFFPFFPALLLRPLYLLTSGQINIILVGLVITNFAALVAVIVWFIFLKSVINTRSAWWGVLFLLCFPTSLFFGAYYTESLFFLAVIAAFLFAKQKKWLLVAIATLVATSTRVVGVFLLPALAVEVWLQWRSTQTAAVLKSSLLSQLSVWVKTSWKELLCISAGSLGILGYMLYLWSAYGDPLYFLHVQNEFGAGRSEGLVLYPQVLWRSIKILLTLDPTTLRYYTSVLEFLAGSLGLVGLVLSAFKVRLSYVIFALGAFFMPTLTGTFSSMPRYIMICFPLYMYLVLVLEHRPRTRALVLVGCSLLVIINTIIFIQGYWLS